MFEVRSGHAPDAARAAKSNPSTKDKSMTPAFNPIEYSSELEAAGVEKAQAAVHAKALSTVLADVVYTHDLVKLEGNLRKEIQHSEEKLTARIESVRTDLGARIDIVQTSLNAKIDSVRSSLDIVRIELDTARKESNARFMEVDVKFMEVNTNVDRLRMETASQFVETNSKFYSLNVEMVIHRWALGILMAMSATTLALVVKPLLA
jgi:hypothetical protein